MPNKNLRHLYEQTKNPLYAWEAIALALKANDPTIPQWCLPYLREAAVNLMELAASPRPMESISKALSLSRQGKRNAFAELNKDRRDAEFAKQLVMFERSRELRFDEHSGKFFASNKPYPFFRDTVLSLIQRKLNIARDRAQRIITRGKRLLRRR